MALHMQELRVGRTGRVVLRTRVEPNEGNNARLNEGMRVVTRPVAIQPEVCETKEDQIIAPEASEGVHAVLCATKTITRNMVSKTSVRAKSTRRFMRQSYSKKKTGYVPLSSGSSALLRSSPGRKMRVAQNVQPVAREELFDLSKTDPNMPRTWFAQAA